MTQEPVPPWADPDDRLLSSRLRACVAGASLPAGFASRLTPALVARRRARRRRRAAAIAAVALLFALPLAAAAFSSTVREGREPAVPAIAAGSPARGGGAFFAGWSLAGICESFRRRRRRIQSIFANPDNNS